MEERTGKRILFVLKHAGYIGVYASLVRELAARGHSIHVAYLGGDREGRAELERLAAEAGIESGPAPQRRPIDGWSTIAWLARALGDLGRYSDPRFGEATALRDRMAAKVETHLSRAAGFDPITRRLALRRARNLHAQVDVEASARAIETSMRLERAIPASGHISAFIHRHNPDVVLVSPLIDLASPLLEYLKAARRLGILTGVCVASWDNLTSKGLLRFVPERVFVWNEIQRTEANELHGVPPERIVMTGGARFDEWFAQQPSTSREEFTRKVGIDPRRPFLLYLCSSGFVAPDEIGSVTRLLQALRQAEDERLRSTGVVVRPHPKRIEPWRNVNLTGFGNAVVWPLERSESEPGEVRAGFYDSVAHCSAVVGVNTSAMIEAAIVGKSVYTWIDPGSAQEGTIHFHYLLHENGGFLHVASSESELIEQLSRGLTDEAQEAERTRRFVESFVRPGGLDRSATAIYADAVEELAALPRAEERPSRSVLLRLALAPLAATSSAVLITRVGRAAIGSRLSARQRADRRARMGAVGA